MHAQLIENLVQSQCNLELAIVSVSLVKYLHQVMEDDRLIVDCGGGMVVGGGGGMWGGGGGGGGEHL